MYCSRKTFLVVTVLLLGTWLAAADDPASARKAEDVYKNIQVLKGTPADQLLPAMQFISASLGVHCDRCHVEGAFEKDDKKPKQQARQMIRMMEAINQNNFSGHREVTCYSCHRGTLRPIATPLVKGETAVPGEEAGPTVTGSGDQLLARYVQAAGGEAALAAIHSQAEAGTFNAGPGSEFPIDVAWQSPDKRSTIIRFSRGDSVEVLNGNAGWSLVPGRPVHTMGRAEIEAARLQADPAFPLRVRTLYSQFKIARELEIGDHPAIDVRATAPNLPPLELYFDKSSGLLVRMVRYVESPLGRTPTQIDYSDYRSVAGSMQPFRWTVAQPQGRYTVQLTEINVNQPIADSRFAKPEPPSSQGH